MYLWIQAFHVISMVAWFAGLLYLPRLFVYHAETTEPAARRRFAGMERRLSIGMSIAAVATVVFGVWMLVMLGGGWLANNGWMHAKLGLVVLVLGYHGWCQAQVKKLREDRAAASIGFYRAMREIPVVLLVLIVILAIAKPF
ncbi:CopD family protein [Salinisphaera sp. Q1T1-3]|uniref:CopD family protein n=1 Tax=Salinisphaera sp. Q1T1-3 TaxID=2321229 RepID=UPI000E765B7A|nr:CopD family protein [Salinisphaera sp. Q1T1-3]RJS91579.1 CopD family protein [Salinisphaera sp. Q1T1-3]